jgi:hypothetical protein
VSQPGVTVLIDGDAAVVIDDRSWPLWTSTWFGAATEPLVVDYFAHAERQIERARASGARLVMITDTYGTSAPSAKVRRRIGELSRDQHERASPLVLASFTVIESPLIRGVVTAQSGIDPSMARTENVGSYQAALDGCIAAMKAAGVPVPTELPSRQPDPRRASRTG